MPIQVEVAEHALGNVVYITMVSPDGDTQMTVLSLADAAELAHEILEAVREGSDPWTKGDSMLYEDLPEDERQVVAYLDVKTTDFTGELARACRDYLDRRAGRLEDGKVYDDSGNIVGEQG